MARTKLADRSLPDYTRGEEIFNMTSHIVGGSLGIVALILCVVFAAVHNNGYGVVTGAIYGTTMILLYTMSSIYHGLSPKYATAKKVFQILDHCSIFLLIAGSYTPFTLAGIRLVDAAAGWWIFGIIWGITILGIILNSIDLKMFKKFSMFCYLGMGWCIIVKANVLAEFLSAPALALLILGGLSYTVGSIFYVLDKKRRYMHSIFHLFILLGSILHFFCILLYLM
jgi:channel protein, hemolysin III family